MEVEWNDVQNTSRRQIDQGLGQDQHTADSSAPDEGNPAVLGQDCGNQVEEERGQNPHARCQRTMGESPPYNQSVMRCFT